MIHYDLASGKRCLGARLWVMRRHFGAQAETLERANERRVVTDDFKRLCSYGFFRCKSRNDRARALDLHAYLTRVGIEEKHLPGSFLRTVDECRREREIHSLENNAPLCPYLKVNTRFIS